MKKKSKESLRQLEEEIKRKEANAKAKERSGYEKTTIQSNKESCLIVDGYNMIFAWEELKQLAKENIGMLEKDLLIF